MNSIPLHQSPMEGQSAPVEESLNCSLFLPELPTGRSDCLLLFYWKYLRYAWIHYLQELNQFLLYFVAEFISFEKLGKYFEKWFGHNAILVKQMLKVVLQCLEADLITELISRYDIILLDPVSRWNVFHFVADCLDLSPRNTSGGCNSDNASCWGTHDALYGYFFPIYLMLF
jgi:hypothetical protein